MKTPWKRISRRKVYESKFVDLYEDEIRLPNGKVIDDYTLIKKNDVVIVVGLTSDSRLLLIKEFKYAVGEFLYTLPAGQIENNEDPVISGERELLEETGFGAEEFKYLGKLYESPTKDLHVVHVVLAKGIKKLKKPDFEDTETISDIQIFDKKHFHELVEKGEIRIGVVLGALSLARFIS